MGSKLLDKKRKSRVAESESEDELADGVFDGVLSQSEDEFEGLESDQDRDDEDDDAESESGGDSQSDEDDGDDAILSDDIPSDVDGEDAIGKLLKEVPEPEIEIPGVDPKRKEDVEEERNYRIETDANGNERYVYELVYRSQLLPAQR
jgi:ribosome biogenesis protein ERB1